MFQQVPRRKEGRNSYATPTPATDGERVYACFGDGSFAALTFAGDVVQGFDVRTGERLWSSELEERLQASMAIAQGRIFIRTEKQLFCIAKR